MKYILFLVFLWANKFVFAQDIVGTWEGNYGGSFLVSKPQKLVVELFLYNDSLLTGASHLYYKNNKYEHYTLKGKYNKKDSTASFTEDSTIAVKLGFMVSNCLGIYKTKIVFTDSTVRQEGKWKDKVKGIFKCPSSIVWLSKKRIVLQKKDKNNGQIVDSDLEKLTQRIPDIQSLIEIKKEDADSIKLEIYDNGEVDNDTITVYHNNILIVNKKRISTNPIVFYLSLNEKEPISKLKLIAESVGSLPPCTALMIIYVKRKRYEVNLSSDFYKNGMVELFLKE